MESIRSLNAWTELLNYYIQMYLGMYWLKMTFEFECADGYKEAWTRNLDERTRIQSKLKWDRKIGVFIIRGIPMVNALEGQWRCNMANHSMCNNLAPWIDHTSSWLHPNLGNGLDFCSIKFNTKAHSNKVMNCWWFISNLLLVLIYIWVANAIGLGLWRLGHVQEVNDSR